MAFEIPASSSSVPGFGGSQCGQGLGMKSKRVWRKTSAGLVWGLPWLSM
jgi:hypothetical protein